jgi:hypothetical protein
MKLSCVRDIDILYSISIFHKRFILIYYSYIRWVTSKEIHECEVPKWKKENEKIVCVFENELPTSFMDLQFDLLIHLVNGIELVGVVSMRWMFFFERYMKTLKRYVRRKEHLEGIAEGYVLNEAFLFLCEILGKDFEDGPLLWDEERT